jgi:hypothetical protein
VGNLKNIRRKKCTHTTITVTDHTGIIGITVAATPATMNTDIMIRYITPTITDVVAAKEKR